MAAIDYCLRSLPKFVPKGHLVILIVLCNLIGLSHTQHEVESATVTNFEGFGELTNVISTSKTKANLSCESGDMVVKLQFADKFRGVIYADRDRQSACKKYGDSSTFYTFQIPLQGCGTKERVTSDYRMFVNDIVVRFHHSLELEGDEVKTILCRYPPPVAPLPPVVVPLPAEVPAVVAAGPRRLSEVELMLIICAILFLGLLLLGIGLAYYCLKKRNIKIVKRRKITSGPPSQITKLSGSTLGPLSIPFDGIKIPRATAHSVSGSEALLTSAGEHSDTITSDYPSESPSSAHSDMEEVETQVTTSHLTQSAYDNQAYLEERAYIQPVPPQTQTREMSRTNEMSRTSDMNRTSEMNRTYRETVTEESEEYRMRRIMEEEYLRTQNMQQWEAPPPPARFAAEPPVYARIRKRQMEENVLDERSMSETTQEVTRVTYPSPPSSADTESTRPPLRRTTSEVSEETLTEEITTQYTPRESHVTETRSARSLSEITVPPPTMAPETIDSSSRYDHDQTSSYTETITYDEDHVTRMSRDQLYEARVQEPPIPEFDVTIRSYQLPSENGDGSSEVETVDRSSIISERPQVFFEDADDEIVIAPAPIPNWDVLIRVLEPPAPTDVDDVQSILSEDDRGKWREVLTTDTNLQSLLMKAKTTEEFQMIREDQRYEKLFSPPSWDVIIKILAAPPESVIDSDTASISDTASYTSERPGARYRRRSEIESRGRRISLPPLYEHETGRYPLPPEEAMSTTTDDEGFFARYDRESEYSEDSGAPVEQRRRLFRLHRPSLIRSMSEEMHTPEVIERDSLDEEELEYSQAGYSPETSPRASNHRHLERSSTEITVRETHRQHMSSGGNTDENDMWRSKF